jgi:hypothetical protein
MKGRACYATSPREELNYIGIATGKEVHTKTACEAVNIA